MPIAARWRSVDDLPPARGREALPGVYELADAEKRVIYIGQSARDVPNRLRQHMGRNECIRSGACYWRYAYSRVPQAEEAALLARYREEHHELPRCNRGTPLKRNAGRRYQERSGGK